MATPLPVTQNPIIENSFLGSNWLNPDYLFNHGFTFFHDLFVYIGSIGSQITSVYHTILFFVALFFITIISYSVIRVFEIRSKEKKHLAHEIAEYAHHQAEQAKKLEAGEAVSKNQDWLKTLDYLFSQHQSDWRLAVIEADKMLEDLMKQLGFKGETLGDRLKDAAQPARPDPARQNHSGGGRSGGEKFRGLTSAWEVHTIRNKIAHEGASFQLSQHEAKRVIAIYEQIFREFGFI